MNKSIIAAAAAMLMAASAAAQSVTIYKAGVAVASYDLTEIDEIVFSPEGAQEDHAQAVAGQYNTYRQVTLPAMSAMGVLVQGKETVAVEASAVNKVDVTLPACQYTMNGNTFDLPGVTVAGCDVAFADGSYAVAGEFNGSVNGKSTKVTLSATMSADGSSFAFTQDMTYGSMPMTIHMEYTVPTLAQAVSGIYFGSREVTLPAMPAMGVLVSDNQAVVLTPVGESKVSVALPACQYTMGGNTFDLPAATVEATVTKEGDTSRLAGTFTGKIGEKDTTVDFSGEITEVGFMFTQDMKYGSMPMVLHMVYTNLTSE